MEPELVFKALADVSRRKLLDLLHERDGRSLSELEMKLPMTRFGVMKHLRVLMAADLITTRKSGRETLHYLNAIPIQMVYDRWVSKYARGWARSLTELKYELEDATMTESNHAETTKHVFEIYIRTTPDELWRALTDGSLTEKYYYGTRAESDWRKGSRYRYAGADGASLVDGDVIESEPGRRLVTTFNPHWDGSGDGSIAESRVTFEIEEFPGACKLTVIHDGLIVGDPLTDGVFRGWSEILSGLKTLLETGTPLVVGAAA